MSSSYWAAEIQRIKAEGFAAYRELKEYQAYEPKITGLPANFSNLANDINSCSNAFYNAFENNSFDEGSISKCADMVNDIIYKIQNVISNVQYKIMELDQKVKRLYNELEVAQANYEAALAYEAAEAANYK